MAKPDLLPGPAEPKDPALPTSISLYKRHIDWLDGIATETGRSRSEVAQMIFDNVREAEASK